jgi:hypothetical protein
MTYETARTVRVPDRGIATRIAPEYVGLAVAIEIANPDLPAASGSRKVFGCKAAHAVQTPDRGVAAPDSGIAARIAPEDVALPIAVEITDPCDFPAAAGGSKVLPREAARAI